MLTVIKIGGNIIDDESRLQSFLADFAAIDGLKILVHGGGKVATEIGRKLDIEPQYVNGRRVTDVKTLELVTMVYGGLINKNIVAQLQSLGCNAIGLTGADANVMPADKRPVVEVDYGFVGDVHRAQVKAVTLKGLIDLGLMPVMAPLTHDGNGNMLNTNADTVAQEVAKSLATLMPVQLIYCFEKTGVLMDAADERSVIGKISKEDFVRLKNDGIVSEGMIPKLENAFEAVASGVYKVVIGHAAQLSHLIKGTAGTSIQ